MIENLHTITSVQVDHLPAIVKIIEDSQYALKRITGLNLKLQIIVVEEKAEYKDVLWYSLQTAISSITGIPWGTISSGSRSGELPLYKKLYCYYGRRYIGGRTIKKIGEDVGMKNHTSALTASNDFTKLLVDPSMKEHAKAIKLFESLKRRLEVKFETV